jgi:hypothetical protein
MKAQMGWSGVDQLTMALDRGRWLTPCPGHFNPGEKVPVPTEQEIRQVPENARVHKQECLLQIFSYVNTNHLHIVHSVLTNKDVDKPYP